MPRRTQISPLTPSGGADIKEEAMDIKHEPGTKWFIWNKNGRRPFRAHDNEDAAIAEAERLAQKVPGQKFHVMRSVTKVFVPVAIEAPAETAAP